MSGIPLLKCRVCGHRWQFRRAACPVCAACEPQIVEATGDGTVWSVTMVHRAPLPAWDVPGGYGIALVTLDEGVRIMCRAAAGLAIGDRVHVAMAAGGPAASSATSS